VSAALQPLHKAHTDDAVTHINSDDEWRIFVQRLGQEGVKRVLVDYFAVWCGPCKAIAPYVSELASAYHPGTLAFAKVDGDKCQDSVLEAGVRAFPTFHVYDVATGSKVDELQGASQGELQKLAYRAAIGGSTSQAAGYLARVAAGDLATAAGALHITDTKALGWMEDAGAESAVAVRGLASAHAAVAGIL
jgi:thioredoxin 1